jgi:hypothetical protein
MISIHHYFRLHQTPKNAEKHFTPKQTEQKLGYFILFWTRVKLKFIKNCLINLFISYIM